MVLKSVHVKYYRAPDNIECTLLNWTQAFSQRAFKDEAEQSFITAMFEPPFWFMFHLCYSVKAAMFHYFDMFFHEE